MPTHSYPGICTLQLKMSCIIDVQAALVTAALVSADANAAMAQLLSCSYQLMLLILTAALDIPGCEIAQSKVEEYHILQHLVVLLSPSSQVWYWNPPPNPFTHLSLHTSNKSVAAI